MTIKPLFSVTFAILVLAFCLIGNSHVCRAGDPFIVAHRGASHVAPENTIAAFELAWQEKADAIEGDFYLTADNEIVCIHDATTKRTAPESEPLTIATSNLVELRKVDVGSWKGAQYAGTTIPTLAEVIDTIPAGKSIFIEIKCGPEILPELKRQLSESELTKEQIVLICFNRDVVKKAREMMPYDVNWLTSYKKLKPGSQTLGADDIASSWKPGLSEIVQTLQATSATGFGTNVTDTLFQDFVSPQFVSTIQEAGCGVHGWTVDDPQLAKQLVGSGFASITTNRPGMIREALRQNISVSAN